MPLIKVAVVDNHPMIQEGFEKSINQIPEMKLILKARNGKDLFEKLSKTDILPDIIILDVEMPIMNGNQALEILKKDYPEIKVIMFSFHSGEYISNYYKAKGAASYLDKSCDYKDIEREIFRVFKNESSIVETNLKNKIDKSKRIVPPELLQYKITFQEFEVLKQLCKNLSIQEIADFLKISTYTVEYHKKGIFKKIGIKNRSGLILFALEHNIGCH